MNAPIAFVLALLTTGSAIAAEIRPIVEEERLGVVIDGVAYPEALRKDLTSGLTSRVLIRVSLIRGAEVLRRRAVEIAVRYDLWDEHFTVTISLDGTAVDARTLRGVSEVQAFLARVSLPRIFDRGGLDGASIFTITADVLLNPVDRERMEMIRKWVAENSIGPSDLAGRTASDELAVAIFNRIFEQYAKGADVASAWRETLASRPFRLDELANERR